MKSCFSSVTKNSHYPVSQNIVPLPKFSPLSFWNFNEMHVGHHILPSLSLFRVFFSAMFWEHVRSFSSLWFSSLGSNLMVSTSIEGFLSYDYLSHIWFFFKSDYFIVFYSYLQFTSVQFSLSVMSDSLRPHELQHARPPCPSPIPGVYPNSCPLSRWCHPAISSSVVPFASCPQSLPASLSYLL